MVRSKKYLWVFIVILVFVVDRITKNLMLDYLYVEEPVGVLPILNLFLTFNPGAAFSFLKHANGWQEWLFEAIAIGVSIFLVIWQIKIPVKQLWLKIALAFVLGGTLGNLYDRILYHAVIDFIDFYFKNWHYPTFNVADIAICVGAGMLIIDIFKRKKTNSHASHPTS